jgi:hypothetical protein
MSNATTKHRGKTRMAGPKPPEERAESRDTTWVRKWALIGGAAYFLFGLILWWVLDLYINPQSSGEKKDLVQALGLILAGVAGAIGIYFTWRGQWLTQRAQEENQKYTQEQLTNAQKELHVAREGQITERFTRAIEQLGNKSLDIRLGGIYALERTAKESEEDYWPIIEILTAYVRQHAPQQSSEDDSKESTGKVPPLNPDIQAIMTVLRRRKHHFGNGEPEPIDLHLTNLQGANLQGANLQNANLDAVNLQNANLRGAILSGAALDSNLQGADLREARLVGANLRKADLQRADLRGADLSGAHFYYGTKLCGADLRHLREGEPRAGNYSELETAEALPPPGPILRETTGLRSR